jgi:hypothetical protein
MLLPTKPNRQALPRSWSSLAYSSVSSSNPPSVLPDPRDSSQTPSIELTELKDALRGFQSVDVNQDKAPSSGLAHEP